MPRSTAIRYTYEDYLSIPVGTPGRHEIVDGELFVTAAPRVDDKLDWSVSGGRYTIAVEDVFAR